MGNTILIAFVRYVARCVVSTTRIVSVRIVKNEVEITIPIAFVQFAKRWEATTTPIVFAQSAGRWGKTNAHLVQADRHAISLSHINYIARTFSAARICVAADRDSGGKSLRGGVNVQC